MLRSRVIPCLLVHRKGLVKTAKFKDPKYVGDPINAVKIYNEKEVDELIVLDIDASVEGREPDYKMIFHLTAESRMPLCYGGGVKTPEQAEKIIQLGVEKIAISSGFIEDPKLISRIAERVGGQSVVAVLDIKKSLLGKYEVVIHNGKKRIKKNAVELAKEFESLGIGELVVNSVDNDGQMQGYDIKLAKLFREAVSIPLTILGGAGSIDDIATLVSKFKIVGAAAGSLFVFKGRYRAVLISYLSKQDRMKILSKQV